MQVKWREMTMENIHYWPKYVTFLSGILLFAVVLGIAYRLDVQTQLRVLHLNIKKQQTLMQSILLEKAKALPAGLLSVHIDQLTAHIAEQNQITPTADKLPSILDAFYAAGKPLGLVFHSVKPLPSIKHPYYDVLPIHMVIAGNYHMISQWVAQIINIQPGMGIADFEISVADPKKTMLINPLLMATINVDVIIKTDKAHQD